MCVNNGVAAVITYFVNLTSYFSVSFLSVTTGSSSISSSNNFFEFVDIFVNVHNSNYVKLITVLPDPCDSGKFVPVFLTKACN